jgi:hypothetical protein
MTAPLATPLVQLSEVQAEANIAAATDAYNRVRTWIVEASAALQGVCKRRFDHRIDTLYHTPLHHGYGGDLLSAYDLLLADDLQSVVAITNGDSSAISSGYTLEPRGVTTKTRVRLNSTGAVTWTYSAVDAQGSVAVQGVWGYGGDWTDTGTTLNGAIVSTSAVTFTSSAGTSLEVGMVLKVDSEYMYVSAISSNTITVTRGYNGSTAATHLTAAVVYRFVAHPVVAHIVKRLVIYFMERQKSPLFGQVVVNDLSFPITTDQWPKDVWATIKTNRLIRLNRIVAV